MSQYYWLSSDIIFALKIYKFRKVRNNFDSFLTFEDYKAYFNNLGLDLLNFEFVFVVDPS